MLLVKLPWLPPFDSNTASVVAALSSTVLAVVGAFGLWAYQVRARQRDMGQVVAPLFEGLYTSLKQIRAVSQEDSARDLLQAIKGAVPDAAVGELRPVQIAEYQSKVFPRSVESALVEANLVLAHWGNLQDALLSISPKLLPTLLNLHRIASGAVDQLPKLQERARPKYLEQIAPQVPLEDLRLLDWAIGRLANLLNELDGGSRDDSAFHAMEPGRAAAIKLLSEARG